MSVTTATPDTSTVNYLHSLRLKTEYLKAPRVSFGSHTTKVKINLLLHLKGIVQFNVNIGAT